MSQRDIYHDAVKTALEQGNWSRPEIEFHKLPQAHAHLSWAKAGTFKPLDLFQKFVSLAFDFTYLLMYLNQLSGSMKRFTLLPDFSADSTIHTHAYH